MSDQPFLLASLTEHEVILYYLYKERKGGEGDRNLKPKSSNSLPFAIMMFLFFFKSPIWLKLQQNEVLRGMTQEGA